jgi:hypothetical protein
MLSPDKVGASPGGANAGGGGLVHMTRLHERSGCTKGLKPSPWRYPASRQGLRAAREGLMPAGSRRQGWLDA